VSTPLTGKSKRLLEKLGKVKNLKKLEEILAGFQEVLLLRKGSEIGEQRKGGKAKEKKKEEGERRK